MEWYDLLVEESALNIRVNTRILLARNSPVALVVGAAGFFGSYLAEKLLSKNIQVVGVDSLDEGKKENLTKAIEDKNFHLLIENIEKLNLELERIDYIFILPKIGINIKKILDFFKGKKPRLLFISSIGLYNSDIPDKLGWLKQAESEIAKAAKENNLNARILRLGPVFGPRMDFNDQDPIVRLIAQSLIHL